MSDSTQNVILSARHGVTRFACGITRDPADYNVRSLGGITYHGVGHTESLEVWQDNETKQIFWSEYWNETEIYLRDEDKEYFDLKVLLPSKLVQFIWFVKGWGSQYWCYYQEDREKLIAALHDAILESPTDEWIQLRREQFRKNK